MSPLKAWLMRVGWSILLVVALAIVARSMGLGS